MVRANSFLAVLMGVAAPAHATDAAFCTALDGLRTETTNTGVPQRIAVIKEEEMTFACRRNADVGAQVAFCDAALNQVGVEFTHAFPWYVRDCFSSSGVRLSIESVDQYTGLRDRKKIAHMWGRWRDGTHIDVRFQPSGDFGDQPKFRGYWGTYSLVVWRRSGS